MSNSTYVKVWAWHGTACDFRRGSDVCLSLSSGLEIGAGAERRFREAPLRPKLELGEPSHKHHGAAPGVAQPSEQRSILLLRCALKSSTLATPTFAKTWIQSKPEGIDVVGQWFGRHSLLLQYRHQHVGVVAPMNISAGTTTTWSKSARERRVKREVRKKTSQAKPAPGQQFRKMVASYILDYLFHFTGTLGKTAAAEAWLERSQGWNTCPQNSKSYRSISGPVRFGPAKGRGTWPANQHRRQQRAR